MSPSLLAPWRRSLAVGGALLGLVLAAGACHRGEPTAGEAALAPADARDLLTERNWLDLWPTDARQRLEVYRFTPSMGGGVYQDRTLFAGRFELFRFEVAGRRLEIDWPDRQLRESVGFRIVPVDGPPPFDLRLELTGNSIGPHTLYGRRAEGSGAADVTAVERALAR